jgi:Tol biopolymer transport system component
MGMRRLVLLSCSMAAALLLASGVGLLNAVKPAEATFPGVNGRIAYTEDDDFSQDEDCCDDEIYTINPDGTGRRQVTNNNRGDVRPDYSPDGRKIAFAGFDGNDYEIYTVNADGTSRFRVTNNTTDDNSPSYSPDGKRIAYVGYYGSWGELFKIPVRGGDEVLVKSNSNSPYGIFSPSWGSRP